MQRGSGRKDRPGVEPSEVDSFTAEFASESGPARAAHAGRSSRKPKVYAGVAMGAVLMSATAVVVGLPERQSDAFLAVESDPAGREVRVDGQLRGKTPLQVTLAPGSYNVAVSGSKERLVTLESDERASIFHILDQQAAAVATAPPAASAGLAVVTEPAGGRVSIDGQDHGPAPVTVRNLAAGEHRLVVRNQGSVYQQTVTLETGSTSTVVVGGVSNAAAGWLTVQSPLRLEIHEGGRLLGSTDTDRLMLPAGDHQLTFSDAQTGFSMTRAARIAPGDTTTIPVQIPQAPVNVNAVPWAEVWVDNARVGETPIGNHLLSLGTHQVELRHPQLGTKRVTLSVSLKGVNRLAVNMRER
jgi:PEGA domain